MTKRQKIPYYTLEIQSERTQFTCHATIKYGAAQESVSPTLLNVTHPSTYTSTLM